jgi:hypothetical protein
VTKPIELRINKGDLQMRPKTEKAAPAKIHNEIFAAAEPRAEVTHMALVPSRARKITAKAGANPEIIDQIGQHLGKVYNDVLSQPVPDRFLDLLQSLESGKSLESRKSPSPAGKPPNLKCDPEADAAAETAPGPEAAAPGERKKAPK